MNTRKKVYKMSIGSQGKLGKSQGKVREFCVKNLVDTLCWKDSFYFIDLKYDFSLRYDDLNTFNYQERE